MARIARVVLIVGTVVLLGATAAQAQPAGGGGAATAPRVWASQVCTSVSAWQKKLQKRAAALSHLKGNNLTGIRGQLVKFLAGVVTDTDALVADVDRAGTPAVPHGAQIRKTFHQGLVKTRTFFALDAKRAKRLPIDSPAKFTAGVGALGKAIDRQSSSITKTFSGIDKQYGSSSLNGAMKPIAACNVLLG